MTCWKLLKLTSLVIGMDIKLIDGGEEEEY